MSSGIASTGQDLEAVPLHTMSDYVSDDAIPRVVFPSGAFLLLAKLDLKDAQAARRKEAELCGAP